MQKARFRHFPDRKTVNDSYQHDLERLLAVTDLKPKLDKKRKLDPAFDANWAVVKDWSAQKRYERKISRQRARDLVSAITDPQHGVLPWLQTFW